MGLLRTVAPGGALGEDAVLAVVTRQAFLLPDASVDDCPPRVDGVVARVAQGEVPRGCEGTGAGCGWAVILEGKGGRIVNGRGFPQRGNG